MDTQAIGLTRDDQVDIVIVDDEPYIRRSLAYVLSKEGYRVVTAEDGEEGLAVINHWRPLLVFLDVMMPKKDGLAVCRELKAEGNIEMYIILLSARGHPLQREQWHASGADEYFVKPFSPREVVQRVQELIGQRKNGGRKE